jgi:hypothetical protein
MGIAKRVSGLQMPIGNWIILNRNQ